MFLRRLFCKNHKWKKIDYIEIKDDDGIHILSRSTIYQCEKCGKKHEYEHKMPSDYYINPNNYSRF